MPDPDRKYSASMYWVGHIVTLTVVLATFASLFVLYLARASGQKMYWAPVELPWQLWISSALLAIASATIELSRHALRRRDLKQYSVWLARTGVAGFGFLIAQLLSWRIMLTQTIGVAAQKHNSNKAMFYVLTGAHALHVLAGIAALGYLIWRIWHPWQEQANTRRTSITFMLATYWHAMLLIWLVLFALLASHAK